MLLFVDSHWRTPFLVPSRLKDKAKIKDLSRPWSLMNLAVDNRCMFCGSIAPPGTRDARTLHKIEDLWDGVSSFLGGDLSPLVSLSLTFCFTLPTDPLMQELCRLAGGPGAEYMVGLRQHCFHGLLPNLTVETSHQACRAKLRKVDLLKPGNRHFHHLPRYTLQLLQHLSTCHDKAYITKLKLKAHRCCWATPGALGLLRQVVKTSPAVPAPRESCLMLCFSPPFFLQSSTAWLLSSPISRRASSRSGCSPSQGTSGCRG